MLRGLRNRDLQALTYPPAPADVPLSLQERRRRSAAISRKLRLLRAHGLIQRVPKTHRYQLTSHWRLAITAILTMDPTGIAALNHVAAKLAAWKFVAAREERKIQWYRAQEPRQNRR